MANMVDSLLASVSTNGNTIELSASDNGQGLLPRKKEEVGRLQRRVRTFKGNLTTAITSFINRINYYKNKYPTDDETEIPSVKIDYARDILTSQDRATDRYIKLENSLDELRNLVSDTWEDEEEELETALAKLTSEFLPYETNYLKMNRDHDDIVERCKALLIASIPKPVTTKTRTTGGAQTAPLNNCFKPQSDLKPAHLARDCSLPEFITFTKTFMIYMNSAGTSIPKEAVYSHLRVYMDPWWFTDLGHKGLDINTDLLKFPKIMDIASREHFPIHSRRMRVFRTEQKGDSMSFLREIIENVKLADWHTFCEEAASLMFSMISLKKDLLSPFCSVLKTLILLL